MGVLGQILQRRKERICQLFKQVSPEGPRSAMTGFGPSPFNMAACCLPLASSGKYFRKPGGEESVVYQAVMRCKELPVTNSTMGRWISSPQALLGFRQLVKSQTFNWPPPAARGTCVFDSESDRACLAEGGSPSVENTNSVLETEALKCIA